MAQRAYDHDDDTYWQSNMSFQVVNHDHEHSGVKKDDARSKLRPSVDRNARGSVQRIGLGPCPWWGQVEETLLKDVGRGW